MNELEESTRRAMEVHLSPTATAPGDARRFVAEALEGHPAVEAAKLVVSELVTNAVRHGGNDAGRITVSVVRIPRPSGDRARVEVSQSNCAGFEFAQTEPGHLNPTGRGLMIVEAVSSDWGMDGDDGSVWAVLD